MAKTYGRQLARQAQRPVPGGCDETGHRMRPTLFEPPDYKKRDLRVWRV